MSVGIVAVSHSRPLAEAAVALASQMVEGDAPVLIAAGMPDGSLGTDAAAVAEAIEAAEGGEGVVVLTDLGSAILSAEMAVEFLPDPDAAVRIVPAPFVEGLLAAVVSATQGQGLDAVAAAASGALDPKVEQLGGTDAVAGDNPAAADSDAAVARAAADRDGSASQRTAPESDSGPFESVVLINPLGLHARPAARLAGLVAELNADVTVSVPGRAAVDARSPLGVTSLGTKIGDEVTVRASGPGAAEAVSTVAELLRSGFGEADAPAVTPEPVGPADPSGPGGTGAALGVSPGRVVGPVARMSKGPAEPRSFGGEVAAAERPAQVRRLERAVAAVADGLRERAESHGGDTAEILRGMAALAEDPVVMEAARAAVTDEGLSAAAAAWEAYGAFARRFGEAGGALAERAGDVRDVGLRVVAVLEDVPPPGLPERAEPYVLVAEDLAPVDASSLDPARCLALVLRDGGPTSHTSVIARAAGIPAVVGYGGVDALAEDTQLLVDGGTGEVLIDPTSQQRGAAASAPRNAGEPARFVGPGATADGHRVRILANIGGLRDVAAALERGAEGVGLFRTELAYLGRTTAPSENEQADLYAQVLGAFPRSRVVIRTLDAGSDKPLPFLGQAREENPALGERGLRLGWARPELLRTQLNAIARASGRAPETETWVMAPMVATAQESAWFASEARDAGLGAVGIMVETPAAAVRSRGVLDPVDFASIGTNDLAQYAMGADRASARLGRLNDPWQPAVLQLVRSVVEGAGEKPVGVCGEAAADPLLARVLVGLGVTSLSMSPRAIPLVGEAVRSTTLGAARAAAAAVLDARGPLDARRIASQLLG